MSATLRQRFAYLGKMRAAVGGAERAASHAHAAFERGDWATSLGEVQRTERIVGSFAELLNRDHPDLPAGFDLGTPEVGSLTERIDNARRASMVIAARLAPIQDQWKAQTLGTSDYPLNGWVPKPGQ